MVPRKVTTAPLLSLRTFLVKSSGLSARLVTWIMDHPTLTGGMIATSSPSVNVLSMSTYSEFTAISTVSYDGRLLYLLRSISSKSLGVVSAGISMSALLVPALSRYRAKNRTDIFKAMPPFSVRIEYIWYWPKAVALVLRWFLMGFVIDIIGAC